MIDHERALTGEPPHVVLTFGGQTAIDLAKELAYADVPVAGLTAQAIETARIASDSPPSSTSSGSRTAGRLATNEEETPAVESSGCRSSSGPRG